MGRDLINNEQKTRILELAIKALDGDLLPAESTELEGYISSSKALAEYYAACIKIHLCMFEFAASNHLVQESDNPVLDHELWKMMAIHEQLAPEVKMGQSKTELIRKVEYPKLSGRKKLSKWEIGNLVTMAAAVVFVALFIRFAPQKGGIEVATLTDSLHAEWADVNGSMEKGMRFTDDGDTWRLQEGVAQIQFDANVRVVIEAPAAFRILAEDRIGLNYGKVYAIVPKEAIGFTVHAPSAQIIDMGTEFGVEADTCGNTYLHMMKGKAALIAGAKSNKVSTEINKGDAKKISGDTQTVTDITYNDGSFVRAIDSVNNIMWRGQPSLDLADMVRNGNGLGTGNSLVRLHPVRGFSNEQHPGGVMAVAKGYLPIKDHPFIDGIFIPDGTTVISSQGDAFEDFPTTGGIYCCDLLANPTPGIIDTITAPDRTIYFKGQEYSDRGKRCIVMHSNRGITFDLDAIRKTCRSGIDQFTSQVGIANLEDNAANANFYVLVDGQLRYSLLQYNQKDILNPIAINIEDDDRFLTLATTDGEYPPEGKVLNQWCIFAEPELKLE